MYMTPDGRWFNYRVQCEGCYEFFTTPKAMARHFVPEVGCVHPSTVPSLELKTGGRWGWVTDPCQRDTPAFMKWADELDAEIKRGV